MTLRTDTEYYNKKQNLKERRAYHISRKKVAQEQIEKANQHIDEYIKQGELIYSAKTVAEEKKVNYAILEEVENNFFETAVDVFGEELLLERAKYKGPAALEALSNLIKSRKAGKGS